MYDKKLTWSNHFEFLKSKLLKIAGCIRLVLNHTTKIKTAKMFYAILIREHLWSYGIEIWCISLGEKIKKLERKIIKIKSGLPK